MSLMGKRHKPPNDLENLDYDSVGGVRAFLCNVRAYFVEVFKRFRVKR
jgi:hypothetical protein